MLAFGAVPKAVFFSSKAGERLPDPLAVPGPFFCLRNGSRTLLLSARYFQMARNRRSAWPGGRASA
jgi:hypothetical protein